MESTQRWKEVGSQVKTNKVVTAIRTHQKIDPEPIITGTPFCRDDGFCTFIANIFTIQIYGNGIATILTSTEAPHSEYRHLCGAMLSGLAGTDIIFAQEAIESAFIQAAQTGSFKQDLNSVQIDINPEINNILACDFFNTEID